MPAQFRNWDQESSARGAGGGGGSGRGLFKDLAPGKHRVRLVSRALQYFQFWEVDGQRVQVRSPYKDENGKTLCPLMQLGHMPKERYSIWIFDRDDNNELKIMDFPPSLYNFFRDWYQEHNEEPGGPNGPDWRISIDAPSTGQQYKKYTAMPIDRAPFTDDEMRRIKEGNLKNRLMEVRKDDTPEEIRQKMAEAGIGQAPVRQQDKHQDNSHGGTRAPASQAPAEPPAQRSAAPSPPSTPAGGNTGGEEFDW